MTKIPKLMAKGMRGSWFAEVCGELLPCVHERWWKEGSYFDPGARPGESHWDSFIEAIRSKRRVILTKDTWQGDGYHFERTGYIAVYDIGDVETGDDFLRFRFLERTANLE